MNDEMQCVIAGENPVNVFPGHLPGAIKTGVTEITADDINTKDIEGMEGIINTSTQSRDIYGVQPKHNKALKLLALHILKHLPEDILHEEPDFLLIKSDEAIPDYGPCMEYTCCQNSAILI
ncbi:unnamed protein product [Rhizophagus irregularis]|nr:unnamed protein product [Rhizophagus irregularis]